MVTNSIEIIKIENKSVLIKVYKSDITTEEKEKLNTFSMLQLMHHLPHFD